MAEHPGLDTDAMEKARRRMRHLSRWHIAPVPMTGFISNAADRDAPESLGNEARRRFARLSLQMLAVHMCNAASIGSLERH